MKKARRRVLGPFMRMEKRYYRSLLLSSEREQSPWRAFSPFCFL
jgi:hypothetical protein